VVTSAQEKPAAKPVKNPASHVIGHLEKSDRVLTIKSGPRGLVYTVKSKEGKLLFEDLSAEQLRAQAPELHDLIKTGQAADPARGKDAAVKADARLRSNVR
jgi:hypothetical protein